MAIREGAWVPSSYWEGFERTLMYMRKPCCGRFSVAEKPRDVAVKFDSISKFK